MLKLNPHHVLRGGFCCLITALFVQGVQAGTLEAINHTHWAINRFSVDGRSGIDIIGAYQGGGGDVVMLHRRAGGRG